MVDRVSSRVGRIAALAGVLASVCTSVAIFTASSASAEQYCWGVTLSNGNICLSTHIRFASEVRGMGNEKSVCVALEPWGPIKCGGAGAWVTTNYGTNLEGKGWIEDNSVGTTKVFGEIF